jgi:hypothetical protein
MRLTEEEINQYLKREGLKKEDLSASELLNLYTYGTIELPYEYVKIPRNRANLLKTQAKAKGTTLDQETNELLEINIDVLEHQFKQKYR